MTACLEDVEKEPLPKILALSWTGVPEPLPSLVDIVGHVLKEHRGADQYV